jgi:hypothetical protein
MTQASLGPQVLFVHGMGRTPLSGGPTLWRLRRQGWRTSTFPYFVCTQHFDLIRDRLVERITALANQGDYILIGHSLGGVLLRSALSRLPERTRRPSHLVLLGSPMRAPRVAHWLSRVGLFRVLTGDCGQLLASQTRMNEIPAPCVPTLHVIGTQGWQGRLSPFGLDPNDGVVAVSEVCGGGVDQEVMLPILHTWLPSHASVSALISALRTTRR